MHRPLRTPLHVRIWHLLRGLVFYNTVDWRRASDGLKMTTLTPEERERQRPERNLEFIRPRVRPRAHFNLFRGAVVVNPEAGAVVSEPLPQVAADEQLAAPESGVPRVYRTETLEDGTEQVYVKRRRYRRRLVARGSPIDRGGFFARVFGKRS